MRWAGLLLLCSLTVCAAQPVTVTVQPNSCSIQSYQITNAPTTYSLNVTSLPSANSDCSNTNLLCVADFYLPRTWGPPHELPQHSPTPATPCSLICL